MSAAMMLIRCPQSRQAGCARSLLTSPLPPRPPFFPGLSVPSDFQPPIFPTDKHFRWYLDPDETSLLQVAPLRGHILLVGNTWTTASTVQLYGMCLEAVVTENTLASTPFLVWGRNPHFWGYQVRPNHHCTQLHARLRCITLAEERREGAEVLNRSRVHVCKLTRTPAPYPAVANVARRGCLEPAAEFQRDHHGQLRRSL